MSWSQVTAGPTPTRFRVDTTLPRVFEIQAEDVEEALEWRESLAAELHRSDTVTEAMAAKLAGDVCAVTGVAALARPLTVC